MTELQGSCPELPEAIMNCARPTATVDGNTVSIGKASLND